MKHARYLLCLLTVILPGAGLAQEKEDLEKTVAAIAKTEIDAGRAIGLTIGVARGDEILHLKGYGLADIENSVPASADSVYRIGSITKMFTAAGVLLLVEDGKLSLDDPLTTFIPDYPLPAGEKVTVRHLLNQTSGIVSFTDLPDHKPGMRRDQKPEEVLARFKDKPVHFQPGERYRYSNSAYFLLGMIIEKASGKKYEEFLQERIFDPLELEATVYDRHLKIIPNRASGYSFWGRRGVNAPYVSMTQPFAAGALASTAGDLIKWQRGLVNGDLLKPESFEKMTSPGQLNNGKETRYGFGCFAEKFEGHPVIRHGGGIPGFLTELAYFPDAELTVVVLANANLVSPRKLSNRIALSILPESE